MTHAPAATRTLHSPPSTPRAGGGERAAIDIAMLAVAGALLAAATLLANRSTVDDAAFAVFIAANLVATLALLPLAGLVLANARTIVRGGDVTFTEEDS
jgi:hypothetical protein